jgi:hypothetical protein
MKLKFELKKLLIPILLVTFQVFYYNTSQLRDSIIDGLNITFFGMFEDIDVFLIGVTLYIIGYLFFNLAYYIVYFILKFLKLKKNILIITISILSTIICINVINDQFIFNDLHEYSSQSYFTPVASTTVEIDSTNYKDFDWSRKQISISSPTYVITETITFHNDSTFTLTGDRIKYGKTYLLRKLFNSKIKYKITKPYVYENYMTFHSLFDTTSFYPLQIRFNKLYLNTSFY